VAQTVTVTADHDFDREGAHTGTVTHGATSLDPDYGGITVADATINIEDRAHLTHISVPLAGSGADDHCYASSVSNDGRYVAFWSDATNLVLGDSGTYTDVFVRDTTGGRTSRISMGMSSAEANGNSHNTSMSDDGDLIAFGSYATNLVSDSVTTYADIFLYTQSTGATILVSGLCPTCGAYTQEMSAGSAISGDGAFIAYSGRRLLLTSDTDSEYDVYVYNVSTGATTHDSLNSSDENGTAFWGHNCFGPTLSATGQFLGFNSAAQNLDTPEITVENFHPYVKDRTSRTLTRVSKDSGASTNCEGTHHATPSGAPFISSSGNLAVYYSACAIGLTSGEPADTNGYTDVFMRDISASTTTRVSLSNTGAEADGNSYPIAISDDARYVLFRSDATNLVTGDTNGAQDLFVRDTSAGTTIRVSVDLGYGEITDGAASNAWMSRNGTYVVFTTNGNLLSTDDNTDVLDVYMLQLR
jgi:Tol biopolymer transport system component